MLVYAVMSVLFFGYMEISVNKRTWKPMAEAAVCLFLAFFIDGNISKEVQIHQNLSAALSAFIGIVFLYWAFVGSAKNY